MKNLGTHKKTISNRQLILPYAAPYFAYVGIASLHSPHLSVEANYLLRLITVSILLFWAWRWHCSLRGPNSPFVSILVGAGAGLIGMILWIALLSPFVKPGNTPPWSLDAFMLRLLSAGLLVPIFEELMMRGFVFRVALQWDRAKKKSAKDPLHIALDKQSVNEVAPGDWSWVAVVLSTLAFTTGHVLHEWPAAAAFGLFMAFLWTYRKDLITCITAHAVTNVTLALYVFSTGNWHYW